MAADPPQQAVFAFSGGRAQQGSAAAGAAPSQHKSARRHLLECGVADARFRKDESHIISRDMIAGDVRGYRTHLLIACEHEECRGASVALDTGDEITLFRVSQFPPAMRRDRAAGMLVGIDKLPERARTFDDRVQIKLHFPCEGEIRTLARRHDDAVEGAEFAALAINMAGDEQGAVALFNIIESKARYSFEAAGVCEQSAAASRARRAREAGRPLRRRIPCTRDFPRTAQFSLVWGADSASKARSRSAFAAECPPPITSVRLSA